MNKIFDIKHANNISIKQRKAQPIMFSIVFIQSSKMLTLVLYDCITV